MNAGAVADPTHRQMGMESDVANQNFAGARNPDDLLWVQFTVKAMPDNFRMTVEQKPVFQDEIWIEIRTPGNQLNIIERPKERGDEFRFPRQWAYFQQTKGPEGQNVGTPLSQWPLLTPARIEELKAQRFYTVEQIAFASDDQLKAMGMGPGIAPPAFRERAKLYLESAKDNAFAVKQAEEIKARQKEVEDLKETQRLQNEKHDKEMAEMRALIEMATKPGSKK